MPPCVGIAVETEEAVIPTDPFQEAKKDSMHIPHLIIC